MSFTKEEYKQRLKKVQKMMQEKGIELLISHDTNNLYYLTGYDAWSFYYAQCAIVHVNADEPLCFVRAQDAGGAYICLLYTSPSPRDAHESRMPSSA